MAADLLQMPSLMDQVQYYTVGVFEKYGDPRVVQYPMTRTPWPTLAATGLYLWFVRRAGPRMMKDKKPYDLKSIIRIYNLIMSVWSCFGFVMALNLTNYGTELIGCQPVDPFKRDPRTLRQIYYGYMFFVSRFVEFADTIFFVLRKKDNQVSSFHVFHHSVVPPICWFFFKFAPGGTTGIFPFLNTFIHGIMYTYYFLATYPSMKPYLGWKKYLTQAQIVQFVIIITLSMQPLFIPGCAFPKHMLYIMLFFSCVFIYLFVDFYVKAYRRGAALRLKKQQEQKQLQEQQQHQSAEVPPSQHQTPTSAERRAPASESKKVR